MLSGDNDFYVRLFPRNWSKGGAQRLRVIFFVVQSDHHTIRLLHDQPEADILAPCFSKGLGRCGLLRDLFRRERGRRKTLANAAVTPESIRCVQCGICSYNCPIGIDVRQHARLGAPIHNQRCITCGECVARCPRGVLSFEQIGAASTAGDDRMSSA